MSNMIVILIVVVILNICISTNAINSNETDVRRRLGGNDMINGPITSAMIGNNNSPITIITHHRHYHINKVIDEI